MDAGEGVASSRVFTFAPPTDEPYGGHFCLARSPDGKYIAAGYGYTRPRGRPQLKLKHCEAGLWNVKTGKPIRRFEGHTEAVVDVAFSKDGTRLVTGSYDKTARLWDVKTGRELRRFGPHPTRVHSVAISPDGRLVATGSGISTVEEGKSVSRDAVVRLWNPKTGELVRTLSGHTKDVLCLTFSPDGKRLISGGMDGYVIVWNPRTGSEMHRIQAHSGGNPWVNAIAFGPEGRFLVTGGYSLAIRVWDLETKELVRAIPSQREITNSVAVSADGRWILSGGTLNRISLWRFGDGKQVWTGDDVHTFWVSGVAFLPDGCHVVSCGRDGKIVRWQLP